MMPVLKVDSSKVIPTILSKLPSKSDIKKIKEALGTAARNEWVALAQEELKSTARDYIGKISQPEITASGAKLTLTGALPNMVEQGASPHDMRTTVLRSAKAKTSKDGHKYLAIPFRHGSPGARDKVNVGKRMPKAIHGVARHLAPSISHGGFVLKGEPLRGSSDKMSRKAFQILTDATKRPKWHSASIYMGMIRKAEMQTKDGEQEAVTTGYTTFRTNSENVKNAEQHWMHPGIRARRIANKVQDYVREQAMNIVRDAIR